MPSKVFISCGQATETERKFASELSEWLSSEGYIPYVAIETQSILDLNSGIINELKTSDYYIFINFKRELVYGDGEHFYRGSLYTNQELAIAYALDFKKILILNQKGTKIEGMHKFMVSNIPEFESLSEALSLIKNAVKKSGWTNTYSRHLSLESLELGPEINYTDHTGTKRVKVLLATIKNSRSDIGAFQTIARLSFINGKRSSDLSPLKATGHQGYNQTILPNSTGTFDLLSIDLNNPNSIYLNSSLDIIPREPVIRKTGEYELIYEVFSLDFPVLRFAILLKNPGNINNIEYKILNNKI